MQEGVSPLLAFSFNRFSHIVQTIHRSDHRFPDERLLGLGPRATVAAALTTALSVHVQLAHYLPLERESPWQSTLKLEDCFPCVLQPPQTPMALLIVTVQLTILHLTGRQPPNQKACGIFFFFFLLGYDISLILRRMYSLHEPKPGFIESQERRLESMEMNGFAFWRQPESDRTIYPEPGS